MTPFASPQAYSTQVTPAAVVYTAPRSEYSPIASPEFTQVVSDIVEMEAKLIEELMMPETQCPDDDELPELPTDEVPELPEPELPAEEEELRDNEHPCVIWKASGEEEYTKFPEKEFVYFTKDLVSFDSVDIPVRGSSYDKEQPRFVSVDTDKDVSYMFRLPTAKLAREIFQIIKRTGCTHLYKRGALKDTECGAICKDGSLFCSKHAKKTVAKSSEVVEPVQVDDGKCAAIVKKSGLQCKNKIKCGGFCGRHQPKSAGAVVVVEPAAVDENKCAAIIKKSGLQCKNKIKAGGFCGRHQPKSDEDVEENRCAATLKSGLQCKNKSKTGGFCGRHQPKDQQRAAADVADEIEDEGCQVVLSSGKRKGETCGNKVKSNGCCGRHQAKVIDHPLLHREDESCPAVRKSGDRKGELCGNPVKENGFCRYHKNEVAAAPVAEPAPEPIEDKDVPELIPMDQLDASKISILDYNKTQCIFKYEGVEEEFTLTYQIEIRGNTVVFASAETRLTGDKAYAGVGLMVKRQLRELLLNF